jgi:hypothetical protein
VQYNENGSASFLESASLHVGEGPGAAYGELISATPGGVWRRLGEGGPTNDEIVAPLDKPWRIRQLDSEAGGRLSAALGFGQFGSGSFGATSGGADMRRVEGLLEDLIGAVRGNYRIEIGEIHTQTPQELVGVIRREMRHAERKLAREYGARAW